MAKRTGTVSSEERRAAVAHRLQLVGDSGAGFTISQITDMVNQSHGWDFGRKTYERDLRNGGIPGVIRANDDEYPERFRLSKDYTRSYTLQLDGQDIQFIALALVQLRDLAPKVYSSGVSRAQTRLLEKLPAGHVRDFIRRSGDLMPQTPFGGRSLVDGTEALDLVLTALRRSVAFVCDYQALDQAKRKRRFGVIRVELTGSHPMVLVEDLEISGGSHTKTDRALSLKRLHIGRISKGSLTDEPYHAPRSALIQSFEASYGNMGGAAQKDIKISFECDGSVADYFLQHELHPSQKVQPLGQDRFRVELKMPDTWPLIRTLRGFYKEIRNIQPESVAAKILPD